MECTHCGYGITQPSGGEWRHDPTLADAHDLDEDHLAESPTEREAFCEDCGEPVVEDSISAGVWVHDPEALGDKAYDLNEAHAARPPECLV
jgi:hypothetical protein